MDGVDTWDHLDQVGQRDQKEIRVSLGGQVGRDGLVKPGGRGGQVGLAGVVNRDIRAGLVGLDTVEFLDIPVSLVNLDGLECQVNTLPVVSVGIVVTQGIVVILEYLVGLEYLDILGGQDE